MWGKTMSLILSLLCYVVSVSQADPQNGQYSALDSFNFGYPNPYSSLSDVEAVAIQQPFNIPSFHQPTLQYQKNHDGADGEIEEDSSQVAGGRFLWTIYVTATKYRGSYLKTIYCTTSTAAISICTPSAGRRRRFSKGIRGLFYSEEGKTAIDDEANAQMHTFSFEKKQEDEPLFDNDEIAEQRNGTEVTSTDSKVNDETVESKSREARKAQDFLLNPLSLSQPDLQSGFRNGGGRFVPVYATVTTWIRAPRTYISTITAICKSTTAFRNCNANIYGGSTDWSVYDYDY